MTIIRTLSGTPIGAPSRIRGGQIGRTRIVVASPQRHRPEGVTPPSQLGSVDRSPRGADQRHESMPLLR